MSIEMAVWRISEEGPIPLDSSPLGREGQLEELIIKDPTLLGLEVLVVGRQVRTDYEGFIDVLAIDSESRLHVLELKRDRTPRDVVAQTIDYGSWVRELTQDQVAGIYQEEHDGASFGDAFAERFNCSVPDVFNPEEQLTIVASELDPASDRMVEYLAEHYGVPINAVFFRHFRDGESSYLARTWLLSPTEVAAAKTRRRSTKVRRWNGRDFYVVLGNLQDNERWKLAKAYAYVNAGGGPRYWKPLRSLEPGRRIFAYVGGAGYVGVGIVTGKMSPAKDIVISIDGASVPLIEAPNVSQEIREQALSEDPELSEYVVPVDWIEVRDVEKAVSERGLFTSPVTVCKLRDERTIEVLEREFNLTEATV